MILIVLIVEQQHNILVLELQTITINNKICVYYTFLSLCAANFRVLLCDSCMR